MRASGRRGSLLVVGLLALVVAGPRPAFGDLYYVYDAKGQLLAVIDPASDTAKYIYDAVGNLLAVSRFSSATVSILEFQPRRGPAGTTVTLQGTGFGATPAANTVTFFNGATATVTAASPYELTVTVPAGATTGPIAVTAPGGSATTSPAEFEVTAADGAPTITGFTPNVGIAGDGFTITGTEFDPVPTNDKVQFATTGTAAPVGVATATSLAVTVPAGATSGKLSVTTPDGTVASPMDFFVPPGYPYTASSVAFTGRITVGGTSLTGTIGAAGKIGLVVFDGVAGQRLTLGVTNLTLTQSDMTVYKPDGTSLTAAFINPTALTLDTPPLPVTGTYQIAIVPRSSYTGSVTLTLSEEVTGTITVGGSAVTVALPRPGQRARLTFEEPAGRRLNVGLTSVTVNNTTVSILNPDGSTLVWNNYGTQNSALDTPPTVASGSHTLLVDQNVANTGSLTLTLSEEVTGTLEVGGAAQAVSLGRAGQRARLTFAGTAGQRLSLGLTGSTITGFPQATILRPDGTSLGAVSVVSTGSALDVGPLATTGTHSVLVDPDQANTGGVTLWLSEELTGTITPGGAAVPLSISRPGQRARISFSGTAGQKVSLKLTDVTVPSTLVSIINPDGSTLGFGSWLSGATSFFDTRTLTATGPHAFLLDPATALTGSMTLTAYDAPDVTGALSVNGPALPVSVAVPGQNAVLSVTASSGTPLTARMTSNTITGCSTLYVKESSGAAATSVSVCGASGSVTRTMTTTGTHSVIVDPSGANTGTTDVSVTTP